MSDTLRTICLTEELSTARSLITSGFGELQEIQMDNDIYHLPHQFLASGFERLMKCYICLVHEAKNGQYPDNKFLRKLSHDLIKLKQKIIDDYFKSNGNHLLCGDLEYLKSDNLLNKIFMVLSEFGQKARYYNLDIVTGSNRPPIDPKGEWEELEKEIEDPMPYSLDALQRDYYPRLNSKIIAELERFCRSISRQFSFGVHGGQLIQLSSIISEFTYLHDDDLGTKDYRKTVNKAVRQEDIWEKRTRAEIVNGNWPYEIVSRDHFQGDWPFRCDEVIVESRERLFQIINICGYDFALTGATKSRFGYPYPHDTGVAIIGKSIRPFIDIAFSL